MEVPVAPASPAFAPPIPHELRTGDTVPSGKTYVQRVTDLDTGEVSWVNLGTFRPLSTVADMLGIGRRRFRGVLLAMGMVQQEYDQYSRESRNRLAPWAVESGLGRRIERKHLQDHQPFDVLSELGVAFVRDHLLQAELALEGPAKAAREGLLAFEARRTLDGPQRVSWLADHYLGLNQLDVARIVGLSEGRVSQLLAARESRRQWLRAQQARELPRMDMPAGAYADHLAMAA